MVKAVLEQDGEIFNIIWFNQPYVKEKLVSGEEYLFFGRVRNRFGLVSMTNPTFELIDKNIRLKGIVPVYQAKGSLTQRIIKSVIFDALTKLKINSALPLRVTEKYGLINLNEAYKQVHNPNTFEEITIASERIALEEYFLLISAFKIIKGDKTQARINRYVVNGKQLNEFSKRLGFEFTEGQKKSVNEIFSDLTGPTVMNRLLQGDVGSGKTAVSLCALFMAVKSGYQAVMLSPTEVLAKQNYEIISKYFNEYNTVFLSGSVSAKDKTLIKSKIISGEANIVCGTHAVLQSDVVFKNLSLCICDEQQRFGVAQRNSLVEKGITPDVLVMSATPIPRTLSLIFYGDLDISTITDKPMSRAKIQTNIVPKAKYLDMLKFIQKQVESGRQAFFVCPKIEGDDEGTLMSVNEIFDELKNKLPRLNISILHGKMKDAEKQQVMIDFKQKKYDALVSTTVIEVGIDIPNATVMVIYGADRFGLSQLHQLRGRVGRSSLDSYCFLLSDNESETSIKRLKIISSNDDGFKISEFDVEERGSGDFFGTRQSGKMLNDLGALRYSTQTIFLAKKLSDEAFSSGENISDLKQKALSKFSSLKDVTLN